MSWKYVITLKSDGRQIAIWQLSDFLNWADPPPGREHFSLDIARKIQPLKKKTVIDSPWTPHYPRHHSRLDFL